MEPDTTVAPTLVKAVESKSRCVWALSLSLEPATTAVKLPQFAASWASMSPELQANCFAPLASGLPGLVGGKPARNPLLHLPGIMVSPTPSGVRPLCHQPITLFVSAFGPKL